MTFVLDTISFNRDMVKLQTSFELRDQEYEQLEAKYKKASEANHYLVNQITRLARVAALVERPAVRTRLAQKKGTKVNLVMIPPQPDKFDMFEKYIELKPTPHFAERQIDRARWDSVWNCNCPLTCDCWIGRKCSTHGCRAAHIK